MTITTPEQLLINALEHGEPISVDLVGSVNVTRLAEMVIEEIGRPRRLVPALHVPRLASEMAEPWPPKPLTGDTTPAVTYVLAVARGDRAAGRLAENVDPIALGWLVLQAREWPPSTRPAAMLGLFQESEWERHANAS